MDVERIKIELPVKRPKFVNLYLVDGKYLIDGGLLETSFVNTLAERLGEMKDVLITHHHVDHIGLAMLNNFIVYMHPTELRLRTMNLDSWPVVANRAVRHSFQKWIFARIAGIKPKKCY